MLSKFEFYEVIKIVSDCKHYQEVNDFEAVVLGMSENESGDWGCSVQVIESEESWSLSESELISTGKKLTRSDLYDGSSVRVAVDPESSEGSIVNK